MKKVVLCLVFAVLVFGASLSFAKPNNIFKIERNKNANVVMYDAILKDDGAIDPKNPIDAYWLLFAKDGRREELGIFDKKAYGFSIKANGDGSFDLALKAVEDRPIRVLLVKGEPKGIIKINGIDCYLSKVYVQASGLSVQYYVLTGTDIQNGAAVEEKVLNK
jgi:hypothetical protein